ncbi:hypothetical protein LEP3755_42980 [Leptolyngbya sp. NIES-3755]|nr:hypothetical protein LEP3755_42980 [Leptolyngbya sp. NIES-3755]
MFTFILTAAIGAYLSRRVNFISDNGLADVAVNYRQIWQDAIALWAMLGFICNWVILTGRNTRNYFDGAILPWLNGFGISLSLPTLQLPALPQTQID